MLSFVREVFVFSASPNAFAPSPPILLAMSFNENICVVMCTKWLCVNEKSSLLIDLFSFNASAITAAPFGPKLFYKISIH